MTPCRSCELTADPGKSPGGSILDTGLWSLTHAIEPIPMVGWLILQPRRHVEHFADLTADEALQYGPLVQHICQTLSTELAPAKIYLAMFAEARGFAHLHTHLIPRSADMPEERRGPRVFEYLRQAGTENQNLGDVRAAIRLAESLRVRLSTRQQSRGSSSA